MTSSESFAAFVLGAITGAFVAYLWTWRFARRLEALGVSLAQYDASHREASL